MFSHLHCCPHPTPYFLPIIGSIFLVSLDVLDIRYIQCACAVCAIFQVDCSCCYPSLPLYPHHVYLCCYCLPCDCLLDLVLLLFAAAFKFDKLGNNCSCFSCCLSFLFSSSIILVFASVLSCPCYSIANGCLCFYYFLDWLLNLTLPDCSLLFVFVVHVVLVVLLAVSVVILVFSLFSFLLLSKLFFWSVCFQLLSFFGWLLRVYSIILFLSLFLPSCCHWCYICCYCSVFNFCCCPRCHHHPHFCHFVSHHHCCPSHSCISCYPPSKQVSLLQA